METPKILCQNILVMWGLIVAIYISLWSMEIVQTKLPNYAANLKPNVR